MNENQVNEAPVDGATPRPKWRGSRARIGVLAAVLGIIGAFLLLAIVAPPTVDAADVDWQERILLAGLVSPAGSIAMIQWGGLSQFLDSIGGLFGLGGGSGNANAQELARAWANGTSHSLEDQMYLASVNANNIGSYTQIGALYYERTAYNGALGLYRNQTASGETHIYDSDYVLDHSGIADEMSGSITGAYAGYNAVLRQLDTINAAMIGDYAKNGVTIGVQASGNSISSTITYDSPLIVRLTTFCNTPAGKNVWLNQSDMVFCWNLGYATTTGNVVITDADGNIVYSEAITLESGNGIGIDLAIQDIPSGRYNVQMPDSKWIWSANAAEDYSGSGIVAPGIAVYAISGDTIEFKWGWAGLPSNQGFASSGYWTQTVGRPWYSVSLYDRYAAGGWPYIQLTYPDGRDTAIADTISLKPFIESCWNASKSWRQVLYAATIAGQASYQVLLSNGGMGANGEPGEIAFPPIDIVLPNYVDGGYRNMTAESLMGMYYAYLQGLNKTFQNSTVLDPNTINVTTESLDLILRGSVYAPDGTMIISNTTVFTLYSGIDDIHLRAGQNITLAGPGWIVTWADEQPTMAGYFKSAGAGHHNITYLTVGEGWTIAVDEISYQQKLVQEQNLTVTHLKTYTPPELHGFTDSTVKNYDHGSWWAENWGIVVVIVGVIMVIVGIMMEQGYAILIGGIVAILGLAAWYLSANPIDLGLFYLGNAPEYLKMWWRST